MLNYLVEGGVAAVISGIVAVVITLATGKREDAVRADEQTRAEKLRGEDRDVARQLRLEEREVAATVRAEERTAARREQVASDGKNEARALLDVLAELDAAHRAEPYADYGTYTLQQDITRRIQYQLRLVPDPKVREAVRDGIRVINETWVLETMGELDDLSGRQAQRGVLDELMDIVGQYITDEEWNGAYINGLKKIQADIDKAYVDYDAAHSSKPSR